MENWKKTENNNNFELKKIRHKSPCVGALERSGLDKRFCNSALERCYVAREIVRFPAKV